MSESKKYDLGVVKSHPLKYAIGQFIGTMRTWIFCKRHGLQCNEWWGIYQKGTDNVVASFGNMPNAKKRASIAIKVLDKEDIDKKWFK